MISKIYNNCVQMQRKKMTIKNLIIAQVIISCTQYVLSHFDVLAQKYLFVVALKRVR